MMNTYFCQAGASAEFGILDGHRVKGTVGNADHRHGLFKSG
jgi:hypothetical protein